MFKVKEIVRTSGKGRTANWGVIEGMVTRVLEKTVFVQWQDCAVEDEMKFDEVISTGKFADSILQNYRELRASGDNNLAAGQLLKINSE